MGKYIRGSYKLCTDIVSGAFDHQHDHCRHDSLVDCPRVQAPGMVALSTREEGGHLELADELFSRLIAIQKAFRQRYPELQLCQLGLSVLVVQDVSVHDRCVQEVEKHSLPPLDGTVCKPIVQDHLICWW